MQDERHARAQQSIRKQRGRRLIGGANTLAAVLLALLLVGMVNFLAARHHQTWTVSRHAYYRLSPRTTELLAAIRGRVDIVVFYRQDHPLYDDVRRLLGEYRRAAEACPELQLALDFVDPERDIARTKELAQQYDVQQDGTVVFAFAGRIRRVTQEDIVRYEQPEVDVARMLRGEPQTVQRRMLAFTGEQAFSSALYNLTHTRTPTVGFLTGHGEHSIDDYGKQAGYSAIARALRRDDIIIRPTVIGADGAVASDCDLLVVAGPDKQLSTQEADAVSRYLQQNGRLLVLLDPGIVSGLEPLLAEWGVHLAHDIVIGASLTGRELVVSCYGDHPITRNLRNTHTMFYMPRSVEPATPEPRGDADTADRPRVTALALTLPDGWADADLKESPPRFDVAHDRRGPVSVAVAVERGTVGDINVALKPTRFVVIGDSYLVANGSLASGMGGNLEFFMNTVNWLLERESRLAIGPQVPNTINLCMTRRELWTLFALLSGVLPVTVIAAGLWVWWNRR